MILEIVMMSYEKVLDQFLNRTENRLKLFRTHPLLFLNGYYTTLDNYYNSVPFCDLRKIVFKIQKFIFKTVATVPF